jgi:DNA-binding CsgD family transcriptional regulator
VSWQSPYMPRPQLRGGPPPTPVVPRERVGLVEPFAPPKDLPIPAIVHEAQVYALSASEKAALLRRLTNATVAEKRKEERRLSDDEFLQQLPGPPRAKRILRAIAEEHEIKCVEILGDRRMQLVVKARQAVMCALVDQLPDWSIARIGRFIRRDHTTILHALKTIGKHHGRPVGLASRLSEEKLATMREMREHGHTYEEIADALHCHENTIRQHCKRLHVPGGERSLEFDAKITELRQRGWLYREIAKHIGKSDGFVLSRARKLKFPSLKRGWGNSPVPQSQQEGMSA